jgi:hypothetical protein
LKGKGTITPVSKRAVVTALSQNFESVEVIRIALLEITISNENNVQSRFQDAPPI